MIKMHHGFLVKPQELQKITSIVGVNVRDFQKPLQKWWVKQKNIEDAAVMGMIGYLWILGGSNYFVVISGPIPWDALIESIDPERPTSPQKNGGHNSSAN